MQRIVRPLIMAFLLTLLALPAWSEGVKSFAVMPFQVNGSAAYKHLERAIPQMLTSRLYWREHFHSIDKGALAGVAVPASTADAVAAISSLGVDYLIYGSATIIGADSSIDLQVVGKDGVSWPRSASAPVAQMIPTLKNLANAINSEVFKKPSASPAPSTAQAPKVINQMNPAITHNQVSQNQQVYLNPQFRYAGKDTNSNRIRSNSLKLQAHSMLVADFDGNGKNEVLLVDKHTLNMFDFNDGHLTPKGSYKVPLNFEQLVARNIDLDRDNIQEIVISGINSEGKARSYVFNYTASGFVLLDNNIKFFLNVIKRSPDYLPELVGQQLGQGAKMWRSGVFEVRKSGKSLIKGGPIALPEKGNLYNCFWLPANGDKDQPKIVVVTPKKERLRVFTEKFASLYQTDDGFSGASVGLPHEMTPSLMGNDDVLIDRKYFIPLNMPVIDLDGDGQYEILANKPISVSAQFFDRYRFFPQGEIHSLLWDGVGLSLQWKTRRIKGSVVSYTVADANNDGIRDLVVCINTHPGVTGLKARRTMVLAYPLDLSKTSPDAQVHQSYSAE